VEQTERLKAKAMDVVDMCGYSFKISVGNAATVTEWQVDLGLTLFLWWLWFGSFILCII